MNQSRAVAFTVRRQDLGFLGADLRPTIEPGAFDIWIAPNARAGEPVRFDLLPPP